LWHLSVSETSLLALSDRELDRLNGPVHTIINREARMHYNPATNTWSEQQAIKTTYKNFDSNGHCIEEGNYAPDGTLYYISTYEYDSQGLLEKEETKFSKGNPMRSTPSDADAIERRIKIAHWKENNARNTTLQKYTSTLEANTIYDGRWNITEEEADPSNPDEKRTYWYDSNDRCTDERRYKNGQLTASYKYQYETDDYGNWVKQLVNISLPEYPESGFTPIAIRYREITYY